MILAISLTFVGFALIFVEFFLPGAVLALIGGFCVVAGITIASTLQWPLFVKVLYAALSIGGTVAACKIALWLIKTRGKNGLLLGKDQEDFTATQLEQTFFGKQATVASDLKPSGYIFIEGQKVQAKAQGTYILEGTRVLIQGGESNYYLVKEVT